MNQSYKILIHTCPTQRRITQILLHMRFSPSTKSGEISKRCLIIIMRIPQWMRPQGMTRRHTSKDRLPHVLRRVDSGILSFRLDLADQLRQELTITRSIMPTPRAPRTGVRLDINPHGTV